MTYNHYQIFLRLDEMLSSNPTIKLSDISGSLRMERRTIERVVKEFAATSFRLYRKNKLLEYSFRLLTQNGCLSLKEVATRIGFSGLSSFSRFVKLHTGQNPTSIRQDPTLLSAQLKCRNNC